MSEAMVREAVRTVVCLLYVCCRRLSILSTTARQREQTFEEGDEKRKYRK